VLDFSFRSFHLLPSIFRFFWSAGRSVAVRFSGWVLVPPLGLWILSLPSLISSSFPFEAGQVM
jgi:hypothetical protein